MELTHRFTVPTSKTSTWEHFLDIADVAQCFPGAQVTSHEGDIFTGSAKVKLGPIALVYNGTGSFVEKDPDAGRLVIDAKGKDKRGNGTAGARVTMTFAEADGGGATDVEVVTDLAITGKPAQFGRGVIQDVSDKLLGQFVDCLEHRLALGEDDAAGAGATAAAGTAGVGSATATAGPETDAAASDSTAGADQPSLTGFFHGAGPDQAAVSAAQERLGDEGPAASEDTAATDETSKPAAGAGAAGPAAFFNAPAEAVDVSAVAESGSASAPEPEPEQVAASGPTDRTAESKASAFGAAPPPQTDALNLGATVLPVLVKQYWRPALGVLAGLWVMRRLRGRRRARRAAADQAD